MAGAVAARPVGAALGLEGLHRVADDQVLLAQHVGQHMIGFKLEVVGLELQRHMAVAQVVGGAHQIERRAVLGAGTHHQHRLRGGQHADQRAVLGHQHIATPDGGAARQEHAQPAAQRVGGIEAAFLPHVPVEFDLGGAFDQHGGQTAAAGDELVDGQHGAIVSRIKNGRAAGGR